jgi:hypothetical protein
VCVCVGICGCVGGVEGLGVCVSDYWVTYRWVTVFCVCECVYLCVCVFVCVCVCESE